jgi:heme A synthase
MPLKISLADWPASAERLGMLLMVKIAFMMSSVLGVVKNPRGPHRDFVRVFILIIFIRLSETSASGGHVMPLHIAVHRAFVLMKSWLQKCIMRMPRNEREVATLMHRGLARLVENGDHLD